MENRAAAAHAETSKTWTRLLDQGAHRLTEVGQLKAPVDYAQAGATTPAPSRKPGDRTCPARKRTAESTSAFSAEHRATGPEKPGRPRWSRPRSPSRPRRSGRRP